MEKVFAKWISKYINIDQERAKIETSHSICAMLSCVITMEETKVHFHNPETTPHFLKYDFDKLFFKLLPGKIYL